MEAWIYAHDYGADSGISVEKEVQMVMDGQSFGLARFFSRRKILYSPLSWHCKFTSCPIDLIRLTLMWPPGLIY